LPYCRKCGTQLEENARFCHKCGTQVVIFSPAPPAKSTLKSPVSTPVIVLVAVVALAVIISVFVFLTFYPVNFNQTSPANQTNQTNVTKLSFNLQEGMAHGNLLAENLTDKTVFNFVSAINMPCTKHLLSPTLKRANP
jgi:uncharacterized protein HemX